MEVNSLCQRRVAEQLADVLIEPAVRAFNLDFAAYRELEPRGYEAGRAALNQTPGRAGDPPQPA